MPVYEYLCGECETRFELRRPMKEIDQPAQCPHCLSPRVARQVSRVQAYSHSDGGQVSALGGGGGCGGGCGSCGGSCGSCGGGANN